MVTNTVFIYHFVVPDLWVEAARKKGVLILNKEIEGSMHIIFMKGLSVFLFFYDKKEELWRAALFIFIAWLLNSIPLPNYSPKYRKRYTLRPLMIYLGERGVLVIVLPGWMANDLPEALWGRKKLYKFPRK